MTPNLDQILSVIRWLLSVGGPLGALLIARGQTPEQVTAVSTAVLALVGALPPIISFVWGMFAHTDSAKLAAVEAMPAVTKITVTPTAPDAVAQAAADPSRPKVST